MNFNEHIINKIIDETRKNEQYSRSRIASEFNLTESQARAYKSVVDYRLSTDSLLENMPSQQRKYPIYTPKGNPDFCQHSEKYNFLLLPDIHAPFDSQYCLDEIAYFAKHNEVDVILCTGDEADNHGGSYHETSIHAMGVEDELYMAKKHLRKWTNTLLKHAKHKKIYCVDSNHGALPERKMQTARVSPTLLKSKSEYLELPEWEFIQYLRTNNFGLSHGTGSKNLAKRVSTNNLSWIIGHYHTEAYLRYVNNKQYAMQLSCVFDVNTYGAEYAKHINEVTPVIWSYGYIEKCDIPSIYTIRNK